MHFLVQVALHTTLVHCSVAVPIQLVGGAGGPVLALSTPAGLALLSYSSTHAWTLAKELSSAAFDGRPIVQMAYSRRARLLVCVDADGRLHLVNSDHMVAVATWPRPSSVVTRCEERNSLAAATGSEDVRVTDLILLEEEGSSHAQLMLLTRASSSSSSTLGIELFLEIRHLDISGQDLRLVFRLAVSPFTRLVAAALSQEVPMLLEGETADQEDDSAISGPSQPLKRLRLRGIAEGVPEVRLARMLRRQRFAEAEAFASTFDLDKEELHRARAAWVLSRLSVWKEEENEENIAQEAGF
jgi:hypothetical protein